LLAQAEKLSDPSTWEQFGPFGIVFVVMSILGTCMIAALLYDRRQTRIDHEAEVAQLRAERDAERERSDACAAAQLAQAERLIPIVERAVTTVEANTTALALAREALR